MQYHKKIDFLLDLKFSKNFNFFRQFHKKSIFQGKFANFFIFQVISQKVLIFQGKFPKNFDFLAISQKILICQAKIGYLQLFWPNYSISFQ